MTAELDKTLLTEAEMQGGEESWAALPDPFREVWELDLAGGGDTQDHDHAHGHDHAH